LSDERRGRVMEGESEREGELKGRGKL